MNSNDKMQTKGKRKIMTQKCKERTEQWEQEKRIPGYKTERAIASFSHHVDSMEKRNVGRGQERRRFVFRCYRNGEIVLNKYARAYAIGGGWYMSILATRSFQDPSVPRFNFLRGLISLSPPSDNQPDTEAEVSTPQSQESRRFLTASAYPHCRLSRSVKSQHPRLKKLIRYLSPCWPRNPRGGLKGTIPRETKQKKQAERGSR